MFGREIPQSRKIAAYATNPRLTLKYSGQTVDMKYEYPPVLREIQDLVEKRLEVTFNHVLLNLYEDGTVYIGNHRDHIGNKVIASLSLGAPRTFVMTHDSLVKKRSKHGSELSAAKSSKTGIDLGGSRRKRTLDVNEAESQDDTNDGHGLDQISQKIWILNPGSLVVMQGDTQRHWKHEIPKEPKVTEGRISLTFRQLIP